MGMTGNRIKEKDGSGRSGGSGFLWDLLVLMCVYNRRSCHHKIMSN